MECGGGPCRIPSRRFDKVTERLIGVGAPFVVTVLSDSRKRAAVERESMIHFQPHRGRLMRDVLDKFRTMGLWVCVANAVLTHQYLVTYEVAADITIQFDPKLPPSP